ncbi:rRNA small subunit methyltransferase I [Acidisarcina polymorpha]|uniref:Ribosomal RNA small subunit methyltransferase I n=1 Tax=Acidisarcina polymorpha TaxID=2211140 RepID=A0A2Z5FWB8_9BACT|nr:16S rRNA (cytidine(1402)-2'-O)-methyltransferase [Acidisarcina polymorpha]AXC10804.1 rRNA small subunit methyltransferase I [Acidisarcina polymorpha]
MADDQRLAPGLYLVGTPIGNLEDITLRALRVLKSVNRIACEDTRQTQKLLNHYGIATPTTSCHEHNETEKTPEFIEQLQAGASIAVVSDAGMPGISDPGMTLARAAIEAGIAVYPIPGANAALSALVASGLSASSFLYVGFLAAKSGARRAELEALAERVREGEILTLVFYEAPHRILETLEDVAKVWGSECRVAVARELTKLHEEFLRGTVSEVRSNLASRDRVRGEITLLVEAKPLTGDQVGISTSLKERVAALQKSEGLDEMAALKRAARERGISKSEAYREMQRERSRR